MFHAPCGLYTALRHSPALGQPTSCRCPETRWTCRVEPRTLGFSRKGLMNSSISAFLEFRIFHEIRPLFVVSAHTARPRVLAAGIGSLHVSLASRASTSCRNSSSVSSTPVTLAVCSCDASGEVFVCYPSSWQYRLRGLCGVVPGGKYLSLSGTMGGSTAQRRKSRDTNVGGSPFWGVACWWLSHFWAWCFFGLSSLFFRRFLGLCRDWVSLLSSVVSASSAPPELPFSGIPAVVTPDDRVLKTATLFCYGNWWSAEKLGSFLQ